MLTVAVPAALASGACFALAGVLQQRAASREPDETDLSVRLLRRLARQPGWLGGIALALLAYGFQSLALAFGPLSLAQPLIVSEMVFAIPLSARLQRMRLTTREWLGVAAVTGGLVAALSGARPHRGHTTAPLTDWLLTLGAVGAATAGALLLSRALTGAARASLTALAGGIVMGSQSVFLAVTIDRLQQGVLALLTSWQTYLLVAASVGGLLLIQSAFQEGPLAASMPVFDAGEPAVAVLMGVLLFDETLHTSPPALGVTALGVAVLLVGIVVLDTSPLLETLHRRQAHDGPAPVGREHPGQAARLLRRVVCRRGSAAPGCPPDR